MNLKNKKIVLGGAFAALAVVLKIFSVNLSVIRMLNFSPIPLMLAGYFLGPFYGLFIGFLTDTVYAMTQPGFLAIFSDPHTTFAVILTSVSTIWNLFTISTMLWGLCGGLIKLFGQNRLLLALIILVPITSFAQTAINTLQMILWKWEMGTIIAGLPKRILNALVMCPIFILAGNELIPRLKQTDALQSIIL